MFSGRAFIQIYHIWEGYLRKILPVERRKNFPSQMAREI
jgi:hypothetical protein